MGNVQVGNSFKTAHVVLFKVSLMNTPMQVSCRAIYNSMYIEVQLKDAYFIIVVFDPHVVCVLLMHKIYKLHVTFLM